MTFPLFCLIYYYAYNTCQKFTFFFFTLSSLHLYFTLTVCYEVSQKSNWFSLILLTSLDRYMINIHLSRLINFYTNNRSSHWKSMVNLENSVYNIVTFFMHFNLRSWLIVISASIFLYCTIQVRYSRQEISYKRSAWFMYLSIWFMFCT